MKVQISWEMREGDHEWVGSINELTVGTIAQAQTWIRQEIPRRESGTVEIDVVYLYEIGNFVDSEGCPINHQLIGSYSPSNDQWEWNNSWKRTD